MFTTAPPRSAAPHLIGRVNDRIALDLLLRNGALTRARLRALTGLSQPVVTALVERLLARGLVESVGEAREGRRGPTAQLYRVRGDSAHVAVARLDARALAVAIADMTGHIVAQARNPLHDPADPVPELITTLQGLCDASGLEPAELRALVVGTPGSIDPVTGDVGYVSEHPEWREQIRQPLEASLGITVWLDNQLNLAALAELEWGQGRTHDSFILFSVRRGPKMSVVLRDQVWRGLSGGAGEIAFLPLIGASVSPTDRETPASGGFGSLLDGLLPEAPCASCVDPETCIHVGGDDAAAFESLAREVANAAAAACAILDPGLIVLTGAIGRALGAPLATAVADHIARISPWPTQVKTSEVDDAVIRGAIASALREVREAEWGPARAWNGAAPTVQNETTSAPQRASHT